MYNKLKTKWILLLSLLFIATSCIDDDLSDCPSGLSVGFTYNLYNQDMEYADAFENAVNDISLFIFDGDGKYVTQHVATKEDLKYNGYRIDVCCLPSGNYQLLAWGGIMGDTFVSKELVKGESQLADVLIKLNTIKNGASDEDLAPLFYGRTALLNYKNTKHTKVEVPLIKNTNTFRILLQDVNNQEVKPEVFSFQIIDKNMGLNHENESAIDLDVTYKAFAQGNLAVETRQGGESELANTVVYAELSTSKLFANHTGKARLRVLNNVSNEEILNIPLIDMVLLMKNQKFSKSIANQTYLDRIHNFNMTFFLNQGTWMSTQIIVNGWTLRFNDIDDL